MRAFGKMLDTQQALEILSLFFETLLKTLIFKTFPEQFSILPLKWSEFLTTVIMQLPGHEKIL